MRKLSLSIGLLSIVIPAIALAAYSTPSGLFSMMEQETRPRSISGEFHAHGNGTLHSIGDVSLWLKGEVSGAIGSKATAWVKATLDVREVSGKLTRTRAEVRLVDETVYARVTEGDIAAGRNEWISLSLRRKDGGATDENAFLKTKLEEEGITLTETEIKNLRRLIWDTVFALRGTLNDGGSTKYTIGLQPHFISNVYRVTRTFLLRSPNISEQRKKDIRESILSLSQMQEITKIEQSILRSITFTLTVKTDAMDRFIAHDLHVEGKLTDLPIAPFSLHGGSSLLSRPVTVETPTNAMSMGNIDDLLEGESPSQSSSSCSITDVRRGTCKPSRPSTRVPQPIR